MVTVNAGVSEGMLNGSSECWRVAVNSGVQLGMLNGSSECWSAVGNAEW